MNSPLKRIWLASSAIVAGASVAYFQLAPTTDAAAQPSKHAEVQSLQKPEHHSVTLVAGPVEKKTPQVSTEHTQVVEPGLPAPTDRSDDANFADLEAYEDEYDYDAYAVDDRGEEIAHDDWEAEDGDEFANDPWEAQEY